MNLKLSKNLKSIRLEKRLTQLELAKKSGISVNYYAKVERGEAKLSLELFEKIVVALKVKSSDILPF